MNKIFADAEEKYAKSVILYTKASGDTYLYADVAQTTTVGHDDVLNLCQKGMLLISHSDSVYTPILYKDATGTVTVTIATVSSAAFAVKTFTSKEPTPAA